MQTERTCVAYCEILSTEWKHAEEVGSELCVYMKAVAIT